MAGTRLRLAVYLAVAILPIAATRTLQAQLITLPSRDGEATADEAAPVLSKFAQGISDDLNAERFDDLDRMADGFRRSKARVAGGAWRLKQFYTALDPKEPSDEAMKAHMAHIEHWMAERPDSITAAVALAGSLQTWAWMARGNGVADTVTPDGWKLFAERIERSQLVLERSEKLTPMCPQWYAEMLTVGLAQGWEQKQMKAMLDRGAAFAPEYFYLYKQYANYLLPKWEGKPGDSGAFAKAEADALGGDQGDFIYFEIATVVVKRGNGVIDAKEMDWPRIKRGAQVLETQYKTTKSTLNQYAFMAYQYRDLETAAPLFATIGDNWGTAVWKQKANYDRARRWATGGLALKDSAPPTAQ